jgi:hypothetical protein
MKLYLQICPGFPENYENYFILGTYYLMNPFLAVGAFKCHQFYGSSLKGSDSKMQTV